MKRAGQYMLFSLFLLGIIGGRAEARLRNYTLPYDISEIEWQLLNWTAAWRGTTTPADPFILERLEYSRTIRKVTVYLTGSAAIANEENLTKAVNGITSFFVSRFPEFDAKTDLIVRFELSGGEGQEKKTMEYNNGSFDGANATAEMGATSY